MWLENLEGGLDYLKQVVLEDSLGIGEELEAQMQQVIDTYQCEWKTTVEDPQAVKRFKHFVNDDVADDNLHYVRERGQRRPAYEHERIELVQQEG